MYLPTPQTRSLNWQRAKGLFRFRRSSQLPRPIVSERDHHVDDSRMRSYQLRGKRLPTMQTIPDLLTVF